MRRRQLTRSGCPAGRPISLRLVPVRTVEKWCEGRRVRMSDRNDCFVPRPSFFVRPVHPLPSNNGCRLSLQRQGPLFCGVATTTSQKCESRYACSRKFACRYINHEEHHPLKLHNCRSHGKNEGGLHCTVGV